MKEPTKNKLSSLSGTKFGFKPSNGNSANFTKFKQNNQNGSKVMNSNLSNNNSKSFHKKSFKDANKKKFSIEGSNERRNGKSVDFTNIRQLRTQLPIFSIKSKLIEAIDQNSTSILIGETGCGKTTQIPQFALESKIAKTNPNFRIAVTQPRRVAAISLATRVAQEIGSDLGVQVGYAVRFEEKCNPDTKIKFVTDGMLLRESLGDRLLKKYDLIILDEAHERSIQTDLLFTLVRQIQKAREGTQQPLKLIVMSATMCVDKFAEYFDKAPVFYLEGRLFPIKIFNSLKPYTDYQHAALVTVFQIHQNEPDGDILVFCTGQEEIDNMIATTQLTAKSLPVGCKGLLAYPLYAALPTELQMKVFRPSPNGVRKVIFSTNIAETSITIPGIKYVIDTGKVKSRSIRSETGIEILEIENISKSQAEQRAGRAGRESSGVCYRLYTKEQFDKFFDYTTPEILRINLSNVLLHLSALKVRNYLSFEFMDRPTSANINKSANVLETLGAIKATGKEEYELTDLGKQMIVFPLDPKLSKMLITANQMGCLEEIMTIISLLYVDTIFFIPPQKKEIAMETLKKFASSEGDHIFLLNVYKAFKSVGGNKSWCSDNFVHIRNMKTVVEVRRQLSDLCRKSKFELQSAGDNTELVRECLAKGLFSNVAILQKKGFYKTTATTEEVHIHPSSCLHSIKPDCVVYTELTQTSKCYIRHLSVIKPEWVSPSSF